MTKMLDKCENSAGSISGIGLSIAFGIIAGLFAAPAQAVIVSPNGSPFCFVGVNCPANPADPPTIAPNVIEEIGNVTPNTNVTSGVQGGTVPPRNYADAAIATAGISSSAFNSNIFNATAGPSGGFQGQFDLGIVPVFTQPIGGGDVLPGGYFEFIFDIREQGAEGNAGLRNYDWDGDAIDDIRYEAVDGIITELSFGVEISGGTENVFTLETEDIVVINNQQSNNNLFGTGADLAIYIPVVSFIEAATATLPPGQEFTGANDIVLNWTQVNDSNGPDEWIVRDCANFDSDTNNPNLIDYGFGTTDFQEGGCFGGGEIVELPLPGGVWLMLTALAGVGFLRWRRPATA